LWAREARGPPGSPLRAVGRGDDPAGGRLGQQRDGGGNGRRNSGLHESGASRGTPGIARTGERRLQSRRDALLPVDWPTPFEDADMVQGTVARVECWVEVLTRMELSAEGVTRVLGASEWDARRRLLQGLGGPPDSWKSRTSTPSSLPRTHIGEDCSFSVAIRTPVAPTLAPESVGESRNCDDRRFHCRLKSPLARRSVSWAAWDTYLRAERTPISSPSITSSGVGWPRSKPSP
jgi:hypothetical protein